MNDEQRLADALKVEVDPLFALPDRAWGATPEVAQEKEERKADPDFCQWGALPNEEVLERLKGMQFQPRALQEFPARGGDMGFGSQAGLTIPSNRGPR